MEHDYLVHSSGKLPGATEHLKRWSCFSERNVLIRNSCSISLIPSFRPLRSFFGKWNWFVQIVNAIPLIQSVNRQVCLPLFKTTECEDLFILKTIKANFDAVATVDVLIAINSGVKLVETWTVYFALLISSSPFEGINELNRNYSYWQLLSLVCSTKSPRDIAFIPWSVMRAKIWRYGE